jgi:predicted hotdog family 3-hydroxylacyl-ACP dehydratase
MNSGIQLHDIDVLTLLPQRQPFVMIDHLEHFDEVLTTTTFLVRADNIFAEGEHLNTCALVENIAQTCAARMGYINKYIYHKEMRIGFIGSIRNLCVTRAPLVGEMLTTTIEVKEEVMQLTLVEATVKAGGQTIATAEMKIAITDMEA